MLKLSNHDKELQHEFLIIGIFTKNDCLSKGKKNWHVNDEENGSRKGRGKFTYMRKVGRFFPIMFDNESSRRVLVESWREKQHYK